MIRSRRFHTPAALAIALLLVCGCSSPEVVPSSGNRAPTRPENVKIYAKQPRKYERLGVVSREEPSVGEEARAALAHHLVKYRLPACHSPLRL